MVDVFEVTGEASRRWGTAETLNAASAALPEGAYTTFRTYHKDRVVRLAEHVQRLSASLGGASPLPLEWVRAGVAHAIEATGHAESRLRLTWAPPRLYISLEPFEPLLPALYRDGVRCATVPLRRDNPAAKDTRFIPRAEMAYRHLPRDTHEGLIVGEDGALLEGLTSNVFAVLEGTLRTEGTRVLSGVTRSLVLEVAKGVLPVSTRAALLEDLPRIAECFITSASRAILPVVAIDRSLVGGGSPGSFTRRLMSGFDALVEKEAVRLRS